LIEGSRKGVLGDEMSESTSLVEGRKYAPVTSPGRRKKAGVVLESPNQSHRRFLHRQRQAMRQIVSFSLSVLRARVLNTNGF
jgi:hypothetical protein